MKKAMALLCAALLLWAAGCGAAPQGEETIPETAVSESGYEALFDDSRVHTIDIRTDADAWNELIQNAAQEQYLQVDMVIDGELFEDAAIRAKGNSSMQRSRSTGKYSFKVEFDHFGDDLFHGLDKLSLNNLTSDSACIRDYIVFSMMRAFGVPASLCSYVFVTVNGEDWGFYLAVEGLEDAFLDRNYGPEHGNLYKPDNLSGGGGMPGAGGGRGEDVKLKYIDDDPASYPNIFGSAKTDVSRKDQYRLISALRKLGDWEDIDQVVDTEEMLRYLVVHTFVYNGDSYTGSSVHNYYLYEENGRLAMLPWDYNEAFGDFGSSGLASAVNAPIDTPVTSGEPSERPMINWIYSDEAYLDRYHELYEEFLTRMCDSGWLRDTVTAVRDLIAPYVQRDPRSFTTYEAFLEAMDQHLTFFELRAQSVRGQLDGTIPATREGQAADPDALVDTSALPSGRGGMGGAPSGGPSGERPRRSQTESMAADQQDAASGEAAIQTPAPTAAPSGETSNEAAQTPAPAAAQPASGG